MRVPDRRDRVEGRRGLGAGQRDQSGATLIEVIMVVAISAVILVPLFSWVTLTLRQQPVLQDQMLRTAATGFLGSYLPRDVTIAGKASSTGAEAWANDCPDGGPGKGSIRLVLVTGGTDLYKAVYTEAPSSDDPAQRSIWRRTCDASTGAALSTTEVFRDVTPGSTTVTCVDGPSAPCRQVKLSTVPRTGPAPVDISATRRLDEASVPADVSARPRAQIDVVSRSGSQPLTATFSAAASTAVTGSIVAYQWAFQSDRGVTVVGGSVTQPSVAASFPDAGSYTVLLTVTDSQGQTGVSFREISTSNQTPTAVVAPLPATVEAGSTVQLSSAGSFDPDGAIVAYDWLLTLPTADGVSPPENMVLDPIAAPSFVAPAGRSGSATVSLTVTDNQGGRATAATTAELVLPGGPTSTTTTTTTTIQPGEPGTITPSFVSATSALPSTQSFDGRATTGIGSAETATYSWDFGYGGATGSGADATFQYPNAGQYVVSLTVTAGGRSGNVSRIANVGGAPPAPSGLIRDGATLRWNSVPGSRRYLLEFEFSTNTDCLRLIEDTVGATTPSKAFPRNPCPASATARARVGAEANGSVSWSEWFVFPAGAGG